VSAHTWLTIGILAALPLVLGIVLWKWGGEEPDNGVVHEQENGDPPGRSGEPDLLIAA
jgi:hypothetical protein